MKLSGILGRGLRKRISKETSLILCYHDIETGIGGPTTKFGVGLSEFKNQIALLRDFGFAFVTVDEAMRHRAEGSGVRHCAICFDDCGLGTIHAASYLESFGGRATWYAIAGRMGLIPLLSSAAQKPHLSVAEVKQLHTFGHQIGSHSATHRNLETLSPADLTHEISGSKAALEDSLGFVVSSFCYPFGRYNRAALAAVEKAGYVNAMALLGPILNPEKPQFEIPRSIIQARDDQTRFLIKISHPGKKVNSLTPFYDMVFS